jgi:heat shock protein HslJ
MRNILNKLNITRLYMKKFWLTSSLVIALSACSSSPTIVNESSLLGEWKFTYIQDGPAIDNSPAEIIFLKNNMVSGNASCNRMKAGYKVDGEKGTLSFDRNASTMMMCPPVLMDQENKLLSTMSEVTNAYFKEDVLVMTNNKNRTILQAVKK